MVACSDYFRVMMTGVMRESREEFVELKGVTAGGLSVVVDFAYTGRLELTTDNVEEVLSAASHLQVSQRSILQVFNFVIFSNHNRK